MCALIQDSSRYDKTLKVGFIGKSNDLYVLVWQYQQKWIWNVENQNHLQISIFHSDIHFVTSMTFGLDLWYKKGNNFVKIIQFSHRPIFLFSANSYWRHFIFLLRYTQMCGICKFLSKNVNIRITFPDILYIFTA